MKRWLLSVSVLLGGILGLAQADYVILVANVGGSGAADPREVKDPRGPGLAGDLTQDHEVPPRVVLTVVECENTPTLAQLVNVRQGKEPFYPQIRHPWGGYTPLLTGTAVLFSDVLKTEARIGAFVHVQPDTKTGAAQLLPGVSKRWEAKKTATFRNKASAADMQELALWALQHGLLRKYEETMDRLAAEDRSNPVAERYVKLKEQLTKELHDEGRSGWRGELRKNTNFTRAESPHYALFHNVPPSETDRVKSRLEHLEEAFRTWYYWWLLRSDQVPDLPPCKLVVLLDGRQDEFLARHEAFTYRRQLPPDTPRRGEVTSPLRHEHTAYSTGPLVADGFVVRRQELAVLCARRTDATYDVPDRFATGLLDTPERKKLLKLRSGEIPRKTDGQARALEDVNRATLALMLRALEEDGERAGVSHNASRQLLVASGLLPGNVAAPEWIQFGMGSFFETPLGAPWACPTDLSPMHFPTFFAETMKETGSDGKKMAAVLRGVVSDAAFRNTVNESNRPYALRRARANAWALTYFLAAGDAEGLRLVKLRRYLSELSKLPRDREVDEEVLLGCFARAFECWDARKNGVDEVRLQALAERWFRVMSERGGDNGARLESALLLSTQEQARQEAEQVANGGTQPMRGPMELNGQQPNRNGRVQVRPFLAGVDLVQLPNGSYVYLPQTIQVGNNVSLNLQPTISGDRRSVRLSLNASFSAQLPGPIQMVPTTVPLFPRQQAGGGGFPTAGDPVVPLFVRRR
jgi:hypothetical protein